MKSCRTTLFAATWIMIELVGASASRCQEVASKWDQSAALSAPEAIQAAAADEQHAYAIANSVIVKYDRASGERIATSTGAARHLNSGFLDRGKLYCAHSNFPLVPEHSEIKVLDVESMQLTTFKDFGNLGGSLTWAVRRDGDWWCNFARYGEQNAETFLVRFDRDWKEVGRSTYPAEVIRQLGNYSLSGGIWFGDSLLVTGHDDPVLFELRLPADGSVLEFVATHAAPFTGQGISADPKTGGLVGIRRAKRQVIFASRTDEESSPDDDEQPIRLRVLSYNIHHGEGIDGQLDLERIARVIVSVEPDLVALQEVDKLTHRTKQVDQAAELARLTKMHVAFGGNIRFEGGDYGNAVLSRWPIARHKNQLLPNIDQGEQRGVLQAEVEVPGLTKPLILLATHLDHRPAESERVQSAQAINKLVAADQSRPSLLAGDLNDTLGSKTLKTLQNEWQVANDSPLPTIPVREPTKQIDFVLMRPASRWKAIEVRVLDEAVASDHRAILAMLELHSQPH